MSAPMPTPGKLRDEAVEMWIAHRQTPRQMAERLELWATTETGERVAVGCDGIAARDATIELIDKKNDSLITQRDALVAACDAAMQCIGELPPTQARVEVAQMLQAALSGAAK